MQIVVKTPVMGVRVTRRGEDDDQDPETVKMFEEELGAHRDVARPAVPRAAGSVMAFHKAGRPKGPVGPFLKKCRTCGKQFTTMRRDISFCSEECQVRAGETAHGLRYCEACGKELPPGASKLRRFCSDKCHDIYFSTHVRAVREAPAILVCLGCSTLLQGGASGDVPSVVGRSSRPQQLRDRHPHPLEGLSARDILYMSV